MQQILSNIGNPKITSQKVTIYRGEDYKTRVAELTTKYGKINHYEVLQSYVDSVDKGDSSADMKIENLDSDLKNELLDRFDSIPSGVTLSLRSKNGTFSLTTSLTSDERNRVSDLIDREEFNALYIDSLGYYYIETANSEIYTVETNAERPHVREPEIEQIDSSACFDCGRNATGCAAFCFFDCNPVSGDALSCAACVAQECRDVDVRACARCIASFNENAPLV